MKKQRLTAKYIKNAFDNELVEIISDHAWGKIGSGDFFSIFSMGNEKKLAPKLNRLPGGVLVVFFPSILGYKIAIEDLRAMPTLLNIASTCYDTLGANKTCTFLKWLSSKGKNATSEEIQKEKEAIESPSEIETLCIQYARKYPGSFLEEEY